MELKSREDRDQKQKPVSVLQGDGTSINRILARESSAGQSSRVFYRSNDGVPFRWEMQPGTPKNPHDQEENIPPICPSPLMQSLGLPLPNLDRDEDAAPPSKTSKISRLKELVKKRFNSTKKVHGVIGGRRSRRKRSKKQEISSRFSSVCDDSLVDDNGPFCCSPWNIPAILDEGNTTIYYCRQHKKAFAVEEDDLFMSRILSGVSSSAEQFSGPLQREIYPARVPFGWEERPGTPKVAAEKELIPPPSPPPAMQSLSMPLPRRHLAGGDDKGKHKSAWKKVWFWMRRYGRKKEEMMSKKMQQELSLRYDEGFGASLRKTTSSSSSSWSWRMSKGGWRNFEGNMMRCGAWSRRYVLVLARRNWKSVAS